MKNLNLLLSFLLLFTIISCQKESTEESSNDYEYNENVFFLNQETGVSLDSINDNELFFSQLTNQIDSIQIGDVYVGGADYNEGNGFIRVVESIEVSGENIVFRTKKGSLTDVFCNLNYDYQTDLKTLGLRTLAAKKSLIKTIIFDKDGNEAATTHDQVSVGFSVEYQTSPIIKIQIENCRVKYLKIGADVEGEMTLGATLGADLKSFSVPDKPIAGIELFIGQSFIGPVPITFRLVPRPVIGGEVYGEVDLDFTERGKRSFYGEYTNGEWNTYSTSDLEPLPFPLSGELGVNMKCGIAMNIEAQIADLDDARISVGGTGFGELKGSVDIGSGLATLTAKGCLELGIRMVARAFSRFNIIDFQHAFLPYCFWEEEISSQDPCYDGIQNGDEEGIDCGGSLCLPCPCEHPDIEGLESFYALSNGDEWVNKEGWMKDCDPCSWFGIGCNGDGRVTAIELNNNNLTGKITTFVTKLPYLKHLTLNNNKLEDNITVSVFALTSLINLQLSGNEFTGEIPFIAEDLTELRFFDLSDNQLSGKLPKELANLTNLQVLNLKKNQFEGCIQNELLELCDVDVDLSENMGLPFNGDFDRICASKIGTCIGCLLTDAHNYNPYATSGNDDDCETCGDGIQNGDEEGIDCGGDKCEECDLCYDDILVDDRDGNEYKIQNIGQFWWMAENLRFESDESICLEDDNGNCIIRIYNVVESIGGCEIDVDGIGNFVKGICPAGWHIPTREEMVNLLSEISTVEKFGFTYWSEPNFEYEAWGTKSKIELLQCLGTKSATAVYTLSDQDLSGPVLLDKSLVLYTTTLSSEHPDHNPAAIKRYAVELFPYSESTNYISTIYPNPDWITGACGVQGAYNSDIRSYQYYPCRCIKDY